MQKQLERYCDILQDGLYQYFWDAGTNTFYNHYPVREEENWCYWWHAHGLDVLLDRYVRNKEPDMLDRIQIYNQGIKKQNGGTYIHNWYDDMEWMALAHLRIYNATGIEEYKKTSIDLWKDIQTAWNEHMGGGLAWRKDQLDYKNTPANAPAAILAYRLYQCFQNPQDLQWARKILNWNYDHLVDQETGFVWDGINRNGDGKIDYEWEFTYCQGVMIGALLEEYRVSADEEYLRRAIKTAAEANRRLTDANGIFRHEGPDDCGLFKGIYMRYLYELAIVLDDRPEERGYGFAGCIVNNAESVIHNALNDRNLAGGSWQEPPQGTVDLAQHLSAIMVLEMAAKLLKHYSGDIAK